MSLTTVDHRAHAFRRRVNASALTTTAVKDLRNRVTPHVDYLIQQIGDSVSGHCNTTSDEDSEWSTGQNMGEVTFSQHFNTQREEKNRHYVHDIPKGVAGIHLVGHMQSLFFCNLHRLIFNRLIVGIGSLMALSRSFADKRVEERAEGIPYRDIWQALLT